METSDGELIERTIQTTRDRFAAVLGGRDRARILVEASTESEWVAQGLQGCELQLDRRRTVCRCGDGSAG